MEEAPKDHTRESLIQVEDALLQRPCLIPLENNINIFPIYGEGAIVVYTRLDNSELEFADLSKHKSIENKDELKSWIPKGAIPHFLAYPKMPQKPSGKHLPRASEVA